MMRRSNLRALNAGIGPRFSTKPELCAFCRGVNIAINELAQKLLRLCGQADDNPPTDLEEQITRVLNAFEARGWLSDERYAQALVRRRSQRYGLRRLADELQRAGIEPGMIAELSSSEYECVQALWARKFGEISSTQRSEPSSTASWFQKVLIQSLSTD